VLIDEVGRGTATRDGLAIATAIAEWLHNYVGCRTVFATHFHELTTLEEGNEGIFCLSVGVEETEGDIRFTHRIEKGAGLRSYGIEVAKLAGLPEALLRRAQEVLREIDRDHAHHLRGMSSMRQPETATVSSFETVKHTVVIEKVRSFEPEQMTPIEALIEIGRLKSLLVN